MFHKYSKGLAIIAVATLLLGCAKEPSESWQNNELLLLNAVQKEFFPFATPLEGYEDGSLWLISHSRSDRSEREPNDYVAFDYTGERLPTVGGQIFQTTDSTKARLLGAFAKTTRFAPIFMHDTATMQKALHKALRVMRVGDTVKVMAASWLAYGASGCDRLNGEVNLPANTPLIFTVILREVVPDPKAWELEMVQHYVDSVNALRPETFVLAKDSAGNALTGFYISYTDTVPLDTIPYAKSGDEVGIMYEGRYLQDNFLLDTNIDSVAVNFGWTPTNPDSSHFTYTFTEDASNAYVIKAMHHAVRKVAQGSWVEVVFTSDYGYGKEGNFTTALRPVYAYTPLRFRIYVAKISSSNSD